MEILSFLCVVRTQDTLFDAMEFQQRYCENPFALGDVYLMPLSQHVQKIFIQHMDKITRTNVIMKVLYLLQV